MGARLKRSFAALAESLREMVGRQRRRLIGACVYGLKLHQNMQQSSLLSLYFLSFSEDVVCIWLISDFTGLILSTFQMCYRA